MSAVTPTVESNIQLDEHSLGDINETPLLKALGGHDLSQQIECLSTYTSPSTPTCVPLNHPLRGLKAPKAKGRAEPAPQLHVPKGDHRALVIGLNGPTAHKERRLDYAVRDAKRFEKCLKELNNLSQRPDSQLSGCFNFKIEVLTDEDEKCVPRARVFRALETLFKDAKSGDLLVLFCK
ncbi:unnamed protein product [Rhizoctonia solani]|uniref:Uncharacterized protein n=1 Tax=Rhizoctonia solani TaxID=456999 RepID=A0A8H3CZ15_9AGAM|nr:unnamed protein product [Rhizoctonia solani]